MLCSLHMLLLHRLHFYHLYLLPAFILFVFPTVSSPVSLPPPHLSNLAVLSSLSSSGGISTDLQDKRKKCQNKRKNQITDSSQLKDFPCKKFRQVSLPTGRKLREGTRELCCDQIRFILDKVLTERIYSAS